MDGIQPPRKMEMRLATADEEGGGGGAQMLTSQKTPRKPHWKAVNK